VSTTGLSGGPPDTRLRTKGLEPHPRTMQTTGGALEWGLKCEVKFEYLVRPVRKREIDGAGAVAARAATSWDQLRYSMPAQLPVKSTCTRMHACIARVGARKCGVCVCVCVCRCVCVCVCLRDVCVCVCAHQFPLPHIRAYAYLSILHIHRTYTHTHSERHNTHMHAHTGSNQFSPSGPIRFEHKSTRKRPS